MPPHPEDEQNELPIWPRPEKILRVGNDSLFLEHQHVELVLVSMTPQGTTSPLPPQMVDDLRNAFRRIVFARPLSLDKFSTPHAEPSINEQKDKRISRVLLGHVQVNGTERTTMSDKYTVDIGIAMTPEEETPGNHSLRVTFQNYVGAIHAFQTLRQLFFAHSASNGDVLYCPYTSLSLTDKPRFMHRGVNLDIARNRIGPDDVKRTIDGMSMCKLNRLHLHATDSQSWPLEIPALPELAKKGAYHPSQIWKVADLESVQEYGRLNAVEVLVEVELPGHSAAIHHAFPDLVAGYDIRPWQEYALEPPSGQLKLKDPAVQEFVEKLLNDLLPRCRRSSTYFHIGGDEINCKIYELEGGVKTSNKETLKPHLQAFIDAVLGLVAKHDLIPIVWEDLLLDWELTLPKNTIVQVWRSHDSLAKIVDKGYNAIFGPATHWYLDAGFGAFTDPLVITEEEVLKGPAFQDWNAPYKNWRRIMSYSPYYNIDEDKDPLMLGGEVSLWGELTDSVTLDHKMWPRAAAAAHTLWTGPAAVNEFATVRLAMLRERMVLQGIAASMVQMEWCLHNPGGARA